MNSAKNGDSLWNEIAECWGTAYTFSHDPGEFPDLPYAAHRTIRAASPDELLDAIKDDAAACGVRPGPGPAGERGKQ